MELTVDVATHSDGRANGLHVGFLDKHFTSLQATHNARTMSKTAYTTSQTQVGWVARETREARGRRGCEQGGGAPTLSHRLFTSASDRGLQSYSWLTQPSSMSMDTEEAAMVDWWRS